VVDLKDVECFHCHKKGHYANKCPDIKAKDSKGVFKVRKAKDVDEPKSDEPVFRQIRIRYSDIQDESNDDFIRHWIRILDLGDIANMRPQEGHLARIFVVTGANVKTINRSFLQFLLNNGLICELMEGPKGGIDIQLVGGRSLNVTGDKVKLLVQVGTNMGCITSTNEVLILDDGAEDMVMGVAWHKSVVGSVFGEGT
jgi:hypothetical protein